MTFSTWSPSVFDTPWIEFNCLGWIWRRTRRWHLAAVSLTALSWFRLGRRNGLGYCPFTDWHWEVRARLGHHDPPSYIQLLIRELTGIDLGPIGAILTVITLPRSPCERCLVRPGPPSIVRTFSQLNARPIHADSPSR